MQKIIQNSRTSFRSKILILLLLISSITFSAVAQWTEGEQVSDPPAFGLYFSMALGTNAPPLPFLPSHPTNMVVYSLGSINGVYAFAYDDREAVANRMAHTDSAPGDLFPLGGDDGGDDPGNPFFNATPSFNYGTNLYILIGPLTNNMAWLALSNTHNGTYYQLENRNDLKTNTVWQYGQIVKDTGSTHQVSFNNARTEQFRETYYRGVGGSTVVSILLDPDYNLAVEPATNGGTGQVGKFLITLSDAPSSTLTIVY